MENQENENSENNMSIVDAKFTVTDIFGVSKTATELRKATENVLKSLEKGVGRLSQPMMALLQSKADSKAITLRGNAEFAIMEKKVELFSELLVRIEKAGGSQQLIDLAHRTISREASQSIEKQHSREKVGRFVIEEIKFAEEVDSAEEDIDDDWLTLFWNTVENKTSDDILRIYSKILAGECLRPGSFSSRLLHILSVMTMKDAFAFETVCSMSIRDEGGSFLIEPVAEFDNFLEEAITSHEALGDYVVEDLESLGLLGRSSMIAFHKEEDGKTKNIGGINCRVNVVDEALLAENEKFITGVPFTHPAEELRSIISLTPNKQYLVALKKFASDYLGIVLTESDN